jgi:hypothetical protein
VEPSVDEFDNSEKTSTSSTPAKIESENLTQQGKRGVEDSSTFSSTFEKSSTFSSTVEDFVQKIRKAIANFDRPLALEISKALEGKAKANLRIKVRDCLAPSESQNFKLLVRTGFLQGTRAKYVGDSKYAHQYEGLELEVYSMDVYFQVCCLKPDGSFTTWMKPEELEIIS